jgi:hypothetical protein
MIITMPHQDARFACWQAFGYGQLRLALGMMREAIGGAHKAEQRGLHQEDMIRHSSK